MTENERLLHKRMLGRRASARYYSKNKLKLNKTRCEKYANADKTVTQKYGRDYYLANRERIKKKCLKRYYDKKLMKESEKKMCDNIKE